jgi:hypothetical protein
MSGATVRRCAAASRASRTQRSGSTNTSCSGHGSALSYRWRTSITSSSCSPREFACVGRPALTSRPTRPQDVQAIEDGPRASSAHKAALRATNRAPLFRSTCPVHGELTSIVGEVRLLPAGAPPRASDECDRSIVEGARRSMQVSGRAAIRDAATLGRCVEAWVLRYCVAGSQELQRTGVASAAIRASAVISGRPSTSETDICWC